MFGFGRNDRGRIPDGVDVLINRIDNVEFQRLPILESQFDRIAHVERTNMLMENRLSLLQAKLSSMQGTQGKMHAENKKYQAAVDSHTDARDASLSRDVAGMSQLQVQPEAASGAITPEALMDLTSERDAEQSLLPVPSAPAMPLDIGLGDASNSH